MSVSSMRGSRLLSSGKSLCYFFGQSGHFGGCHNAFPFHHSYVLSESGYELMMGVTRLIFTDPHGGCRLCWLKVQWWDPSNVGGHKWLCFCDSYSCQSTPREKTPLLNYFYVFRVSVRCGKPTMLRIPRVMKFMRAYFLYGSCFAIKKFV